MTFMAVLWTAVASHSIFKIAVVNDDFRIDNDVETEV